MNVVLVDTSVWISFFKDNGTPAAIYLENEVHSMMLATCPTIVQEILQGVVNDKDYEQLKDYFDDLLLFNDDSYYLAVKAAELYRMLRKKGVTIRKPNDCLIAAYAIHHDIELLHDDKDFVNIAKYSSLKVVRI